MTRDQGYPEPPPYLTLRALQPPPYVPVYFIELDSSFHDDPQAQVNDQLKDAIFRAANTKLIRIRPLDAKASSIEEFERLVRELMRQL